MLREGVAAGKTRVVLCAPTGFGKTVVASTITHSALAKGNKVIVTVPQKQLIDQTVQMFASEGITDVGVMQADHPLTNDR
jgi:superfamily II DNA or RNA helicase